MKNKLLFIVIGLVLVLTIQNVFAIGITPGRTTINFEPNLNKEVVFSVINSENKDMSVVFTVRGDLAESITLNQAYTEFSVGENSKQFSYIVNLPNKIDKPGLYETEIVALEMPKDIKEKGTFVGATVAVATQLHVHVPYPSKYAEAEINIMESDEKNMAFFIPIVNRGELGIVEAKAVIDIYTGLNEKVATIESDVKSLESLERKELVANWQADVNPGRYLAVATVLYDDNVISLEKEFEIGKRALEIQSITIKDFELGGIAKFDALVENTWSNDFKDVYLNIIVYNNQGEIMADFKSPNYDISALSKFEMVSYWDTAGVSEGTYDGNLILKYGEQSTDRNIQMKITDTSIEVVGLTGQVIIRDGGGFNLNRWLVILLVILVIANIFWFVVIKRIMKKKK